MKVRGSFLVIQWQTGPLKVPIFVNSHLECSGGEYCRLWAEQEQEDRPIQEHKKKAPKGLFIVRAAALLQLLVPQIDVYVIVPGSKEVRCKLNDLCGIVPGAAKNIQVNAVGCICKVTAYQ